MTQVDYSGYTDRIQVDMTTRQIKDNDNRACIQYDHKAIRKVFEIDRYLDGVDLAGKYATIHWSCGADGGIYPVTEWDTESTEGKILIKWELLQKYVKSSVLVYTIHFYTQEDDAFTYHVSTRPARVKLGIGLNMTDHSDRTGDPAAVEVLLEKINSLNMEQNSIRYDMSQNLTDAQKAQARVNLGGVAPILDVEYSFANGRLQSNYTAAEIWSKRTSHIIRYGGKTVFVGGNSDKVELMWIGGDKAYRAVIEGNIINQSAYNLEIPRETLTATDGAITQQLQPNTLYIMPEITSLTYTLATPTDTSVSNEYHFIFKSGATATEVTHPEGVSIGSFTVAANKWYEVSILEGLLTSQSWEVSME